MRNLTLILIGTILTFSCKKENKIENLPCPQPIGGEIQVGDSTFTLQENVWIENMGKRQTGFFHDSTHGFLFIIHLLDNRLILNPDTTLDVTIYRQHIPVINIPCYSSNTDSLVSGTYTYSNTQPHPVFSFSKTVITYNYIYEQGGGTFNFRYPEIKQGTLKFEHVCNETYNVSINGTLTDGKPYKGSFTSKITTTDSR